MAVQKALRWRWDQGRLDYFIYENILRTARTLVTLDGVPLNTREDLLRAPLEQGVELPLRLVTTRSGGIMRVSLFTWFSPSFSWRAASAVP